MHRRAIRANVRAVLPTTYLERLAEIHGRFRPRAYLEIGVCSGRTLALARPDTRALGIDPAPCLTQPLATSTCLVQETSARAFAERAFTRELAREPLELVFVDGLHLFEVALQDVADAARYCAPQARIVLHDTLPHDAQMALRRRETQAWTGDVWKTVLALRRLCPELEITTLDTPPTGLTVVSNLGAAARALSGDRAHLVRELAALEFSALREARAELNVMADSRAAMERLFPARG